MTKYTNDNTSYAAYRVFETLKFLINQPATVEDIINHTGLEGRDVINVLKRLEKRHLIVYTM